MSDKDTPTIQPLLFLFCATDSDFETFTRTQVGVIMSLCHVDPELLGDQHRERVAEVVPSTVQFCEDIQSYANFYVELRGFLIQTALILHFIPFAKLLTNFRLAYTQRQSIGTLSHNSSRRFSLRASNDQTAIKTFQEQVRALQLIQGPPQE